MPGGLHSTSQTSHLGGDPKAQKGRPQSSEVHLTLKNLATDLHHQMNPLTAIGSAVKSRMT